MRAILASLILFFVSMSGFAETNTHKLVGNFSYLSLKSDKNKFGHEYFFSLTSQKGKMSYPVTFANKDVERLVKANLGKVILVEAVPTSKKVFVGVAETKKTVLVLDIKKAELMKLAKLGVEKGPEQDEVTALKRRQYDEHPTIRGINDKATNAVIFTAGAALLGHIIFSK